MLALLDRGVNMQIEIKLLNDFYSNRPKSLKSRVTKNLTIKQAESIYGILDEILLKMVDKDLKFWDRDDIMSDKEMFRLELPQQNKTIDLSDEDDFMIDWNPNGAF